MADRGVYRGIYSALPDDPDFQELSPNARLVFYTVRLCKQTGPGAIFRYYPSVLAAQTGLSLRGVESALRELEAHGWIAREGVILWVRNGLRYDPTMRLSDKKHQKSVLRAVEGLPRLAIVLSFCDYYDLPRPWQGPPKTLARPSEDPNQVGSPSPSPNTEEDRIPIPKTNPPLPPQRGVSLTNGFERFWSTYPKKVGKDKARQEWQRKNCETMTERVLTALNCQRGYLLREGARFVPLPATWLHQGRWQDEPPSPSAFESSDALDAIRRVSDRLKEPPA